MQLLLHLKSVLELLRNVGLVPLGLRPQFRHLSHEARTFGARRGGRRRRRRRRRSWATRPGTDERQLR
eukprot:8676879-Alexandrium_andersonii.AAC.1